MTEFARDVYLGLFLVKECGILVGLCWDFAQIC